MGYEAPELRILRLHFEERPGLEVAARSVTLEKWMDLTGLSGDQALSSYEIPPGTPNDGAQGDFIKSLVSWNVTKGGKPVPQTLAGLRSLDLAFARELVNAWVMALSGRIAPDLGKDSPSGGTSEAESTLALAESSQSLPSSGGPG